MLDGNQIDGVTPLFHLQPVRDNRASQAAGTNIFKDVPFVTILLPGDKNSIIDRKVSDEDKARWPEAWARFQETHKPTTGGTPLEIWPLMTRAQVETLKGHKITTVQALAACADPGILVQLLGNGGQLWPAKAKAYLDEAGNGAFSYQAIEEVETLRKENIDLKERIGALQNQIRAYEARLSNAPQVDPNAVPPGMTPAFPQPFQPAPDIAPDRPVLVSPLSGPAPVDDKPSLDEDGPSPADDDAFFEVKF